MFLLITTNQFTFRIALFSFDADYGRRVLGEYFIKYKTWARGRKLTWEDLGAAKRLAFYTTRNKLQKGWAMQSPSSESDDTQQ